MMEEIEKPSSNRRHHGYIIKTNYKAIGRDSQERKLGRGRKSNVAEEFSADLIIRTFEDLPGPQYLSVNVYRGGN